MCKSSQQDFLNEVNVSGEHAKSQDLTVKP